MKTAKLVIGIVSLVLSLVIAFQSCATGFVNVLEENASDTSGGGGMFVSLLMLVSGIVGIVTRKSKGGGITAGVFYIAAALIGFASLGTYGDLIVWSVLSLIFGVVFIAGSVTMKNPVKRDM